MYSDPAQKTTVHGRVSDPQSSYPEQAPGCAVLCNAAHVALPSANTAGVVLHKSFGCTIDSARLLSEKSLQAAPTGYWRLCHLHGLAFI